MGKPLDSKFATASTSTRAHTCNKTKQQRQHPQKKHNRERRPSTGEATCNTTDTTTSHCTHRTPAMSDAHRHVSLRRSSDEEIIASVTYMPIKPHHQRPRYRPHIKDAARISEGCRSTSDDNVTKQKQTSLFNLWFFSTVSSHEHTSCPKQHVSCVLHVVFPPKISPCPPPVCV